MSQRKMKDKAYEEYKKREELRKQYRVECKECGWLVYITNKFGKRICPNCGHMVYLRKEDEFKEKLGKLL